VLDFLIELFIKFLISIPGGFLRWLLFRRKPIKEYLSDDWDKNIFPIALILIMTLIAIKSIG
jgi:hypothetical protein